MADETALHARELFEQAKKCKTVGGSTILLAAKHMIEGGPEQIMEGCSELYEVADAVCQEPNLDTTGLSASQCLVIDAVIRQFREVNETAKSWYERDAEKTDQLLAACHEG